MRRLIKTTAESEDPFFIPPHPADYLEHEVLNMQILAYYLTGFRQFHVLLTASIDGARALLDLPH